MLPVERLHHLLVCLMEFKPPVVCVSICERSISAVEQALPKAATFADLLEIRLDCLDQSHIPESFRDLDDVLKKSPRPTIITYRPAQQGGKQEVDNKARLNFWLFNRPVADSFLDIEFDLARAPHLFEYCGTLDWNRVICSHHDFIGVPADLDQLYTAMSQTRARILKIAVQADDAIDCLPVFHLLERARRDGRPMIGIAMGDAGIATRILGPSRGGFLTYASREDESATAPGQTSARELREIYRIDKIDGETEIFGLIGLPVPHSLSPLIHNSAFEATKKNAVYIPFEVRDLPAFIRRMVHPRTREIEWKLRGLSVTAPHKSAVMNHLDWIEPSAKQIGAVNTVLIDENGLSGYNTDEIGFIRPLLERLGSLRGLCCAVIGAGGVASAAVWALEKEGARVTVFGRKPERAASLAKRFGVEGRGLDAARFEGFDVVVNATTLGTAGQFQSQSPAAAAQLRGARLAYDLVYNPLETQFLREAREGGCDTLGGMEMFVAQAAEQFRLWTGLDAPKNVMRKAAEGERL
jgi:3-dehydroquinate dehydratase / shikimate dehydrogenase